MKRDELDEHHRLYYELNFPDANTRHEWLLPRSQFHGEGPRRFYVVEATQWWLLDIGRWLIDKHDQRIEVPLHTLTCDLRGPVRMALQSMTPGSG
ncbi:hypothetical protein ACQUSR_27915 [Streptomyces sp. P1-3]|uniref:hypothetical protein n=1 Tax=Streptomyces sp. P1-3 TaxID=3421658 RepID=UPI003D362B57